MPSQNFINVRIIVDGSPLREYRDPEARGDETRTLTRYVEAKTGQAFSVQVSFQPGFDFQSALYVYHDFCIDDLPVDYYTETPKRGSSHRRGFLRNKIEYLFDRASFKDDSTGEWKSLSFVFGALGMSRSNVFLSLFLRQSVR